MMPKKRKFVTNVKNAADLVDKIIKDLNGRRGLRQAWEDIDDEIQDEIRLKWITIIDDGVSDD